MDFEVLRFDDGALRDPSGAPTAWPELAVLGDPVAHSLSPVLHTAALQERGLPLRYRAVHVTAGALAEALEAAARGGMRGCNLTVPHKETAIALCDHVSDEVREIGATNTLVRRDGAWHGHNTDARGLALALQMWRGRRLGRAVGHVAVIGSGGAARATVVAARALGARRIDVYARDPKRAAWAENLGATVRSLDANSAPHATLVVQCTPLGLDPAHDPSPVRLDGLDADAIVVDLTYGDEASAFLREARARGVEAADGRGMLVGQAALAFSMWFGAQPPVATMAASLGLDFAP